MRDRPSILTASLCSVLLVATRASQSASAHEYTDTSVVFSEELAPPESGVPFEFDSNIPQSVIDLYKLWEPGQTITVCFLDGENDLRKFLVDTSQLWDREASISFDFGDAPSYRTCTTAKPSHIRVTFAAGKNASYVGTDALSISASKPTFFIKATSLAVADRKKLASTILHEFGHALGLQHEHQSPEAGCDAEIAWDVVYDQLGGPPNEWEKKTVDLNLRQYVASKRLRASAYDPKSIMHYEFAAAWFTKGTGSSCYVKKATKLSEQDKIAVSSMYPDVPQLQEQFIANLDVVAAAAINDLNLSDQQISAIEKAIERSLAKVPDRDVETTFSQQIGTIKTMGNCSPVMTGNGTVTLNCTFGSQ